MWMHGQKWEQESSVKLVVIKGAGGKAFCCGGDIRGKCHIQTVDSLQLLPLLLYYLWYCLYPEVYFVVFCSAVVMCDTG